MEQLELSEFDVLGIMTLQDVVGLESFVTPISEKEYLSRSSSYYEPKTATELSNRREFLKKFLTQEPSKRNFVILENMLNCSAKVYYANLPEYIINKSNSYEYEKSKRCLEDDATNITRILSKNDIVPSKDTLPAGNKMSAERAIELDNKALLYICCQNLSLPDNAHIITPGYGSLYIGPFLKSMYGAEYSNFLKSTYIKDEKELALLSQKNDFFDLMSNPEKLAQAKSVVLLDDNVGTGKTMDWFTEKMKNTDLNFLCGAIQYNWINYYRFSVGEKEQRFDLSKFDFMTPFNYPGHKLLEHAIEHLKKSGIDYVRYLKSKSYRHPSVNDFVGSIIRSEYYAERIGLNLYNNTHMKPAARDSNLMLKNHIWKLFTPKQEDVTAFRNFFISTLQDTPNKMMLLQRMRQKQ